jgi:hypothetical protein
MGMGFDFYASHWWIGINPLFFPSNALKRGLSGQNSFLPVESKEAVWLD